MQRTIAIERYEKFILGKRKISLNGSALEKESAVRDIANYIVVDLLGWDAEETEDHMTWEIIKATRFDELYKYLHFPSDIDPRKDLDYMACLAFRGHNYNIRKQILRVYRRILNGEEERFPKKIFDGPRGNEKGAILLNEFMSNNIIAHDAEDLYKQFADSAKMNYAFRKAHIYAMAKHLYPTPLDFLHHSLSEEEKDDFLYAFWQYKNVSKMAESMIKKELNAIKPTKN